MLLRKLKSHNEEDKSPRYDETPTPQPDELPAVSEDITVSTALASEVVEAEEEPPMVVEAEEEPPMVVELPKFEPMTEQPSQRVVSETLPPGLSTRDMYYQNIVGRGGGV